MSRSIPVEKLLDDALIVYAQNGEPLRPAAGFPVRLLLPGWEGNTSVKWLRRLKVASEPAMFRDETSHYTDPLPNNKARQFSFLMDAKSVITSPTPSASPRKPGWMRITGLAWTGRGRISAVDVSVDGGATWMLAELQAPILPKAFTRFELMWEWKGAPANLMSRALDETGYMQPTEAEFRTIRGSGTDYHYNYIRAWHLAADGRVTFGASA
jgi:sulfane dehydrogenase subunit SoxC